MWINYKDVIINLDNIVWIEKTDKNGKNEDSFCIHFSDSLDGCYRRIECDNKKEHNEIFNKLLTLTKSRKKSGRRQTRTTT